MDKLARYFRKLLLSCRRRYITLMNDGLCILKADNALWAVDPRDNRLRYYFKYCAGWHHEEEPHLAFLLKLCAQVQPSIFIDVGANFGLYTILLLKQLPSITRVESFEPANDNLRYLHINTLINDMQDRVHIHGIALSNYSGQSAMLIDQEGTLTNALTETENAQQLSSSIRQPVLVDTLDNMVNLSGKQILIKIDVEGAEKEVLEGAKNILKNNSCLVQIEVFSNRRKAVEEFMAEINYLFIDEIAVSHRADMWFMSSSLNVSRE